MLRDEIVTLILRRCGNREKNAALRVQTELELISTQKRLEEMPSLPWFLLTPDVSFLTALNSTHTPYPADFLREYDEEGALYLEVDGTLMELEKGEFYTLNRLYPGQGRPRAYSITPTGFTLHPAPETDKQYTLWMKYYKRDAELAANIENLWTKHGSDLLINETGFSVAEFLIRDKAASAAFGARAGQAFASLQNTTVARLESTRIRDRGD